MVRIESDQESLADLWNRDGDIQDLSDEFSMFSWFIWGRESAVEGRCLSVGGCNQVKLFTEPTRFWQFDQPLQVEKLEKSSNPSFTDDSPVYNKVEY